MCLSTNLKHLITASMDGIIYIWKLPESLTKALLKLRTEYPLQSTMKLKIGDAPKQVSANPLQGAPGIEQENLIVNPQSHRQESEEFDFKIDDKPAENREEPCPAEENQVKDSYLD